MNWIQFGRLIHSIYGRGGKLPDLDWIQRLGLLAVKLGQVFTAPRDFTLAALVLKTGPSDAAEIEGAPGAKVFVRFFDVTGQPRAARFHNATTRTRKNRLCEGGRVNVRAVVGPVAVVSVPLTSCQVMRSVLVWMR
jgi:hypothetical protein